jgi:hypothetical protein
MKRIILLLAAFAMVASVCFAQNGGHILINNDNYDANSADVDSISATGALKFYLNEPTGGVGLGGGYFAAPRNAIASKLNCFWVTDAGSSDIASFSIADGGKKITLTGNFSNSALSGDAYGIGVAVSPNGKYLYSAWSATENLAVLSVASNCTLTLVGSPISEPDYVADIAIPSNGKVLVVSYPNDGGAQAYSINASTGALTALGSELVFADAVSECSSIGCYPTGEDTNSTGTFWVWGNATLSGPYDLTATLGSGGFTNAATTEFGSSGLQNVECPWFSPAGRTGSGNLYLGASGFGTGYPAGIIVTTFSGGNVTYDSAVVNNNAYYAGNVVGVGKTGTGSPLAQIVYTSSGVNELQSYTVSGTTLTPVTSLATTSTAGIALSINGADK